MDYVAPTDFIKKMIDAGEAKIFMSTRDTLIRAYMAGAILALAAAFAITISVQTGQPLAGAILFPVGFCFNVEDSDFTDCDAGSNVTSVEISSKPLSLAVKATADKLAAALPLSGSACFFSDGYAVPVKIAGSGDKLEGKATLKVKSEADDGRKDSDVVKLVCAPAP